MTRVVELALGSCQKYSSRRAPKQKRAKNEMHYAGTRTATHWMVSLIERPNYCRSWPSRDKRACRDCSAKLLETSTTGRPDEALNAKPVVFNDLISRDWHVKSSAGLYIADFPAKSIAFTIACIELAEFSLCRPATKVSKRSWHMKWILRCR